MIDAHKVIADYLLADDALKVLVGDRIYPGSDLPEGYKPADGPAVLFGARGGGPAYHGATLQPSVQYRSYALSEEQAAEVDRALYDALHDQAGPGRASANRDWRRSANHS